jgi:hypothetical protein
VRHDRIVVTMADDLGGQFSDDGWSKKQTIIDLVGSFITSFP